MPLVGNQPVVPTGSARKSRLVSWRTLSQSRATSFSERGLGIGCYSVSRPLLMLLLLPFSQQAPSVRCALHGRARGPAESSDRGGDSAIPPLWKNAGASIGSSKNARRRKSGGIAGSLTARLTEVRTADRRACLRISGANSRGVLFLGPLPNVQ